jgi:hypothetical protein
MRATTDLAAKQSIFENGANAVPLTLAGLSTNASQYDDFPLYNVYKYAFYELGVTVENDEAGYFDGSPIEQYGNTLISDLFDMNISRIEGDGALILNVVMSYWGTLYKMLQLCEAAGAESEMVAFLDQAAALWVGQGQVRASNVHGYMLYNLAEIAGTNFEQDGSSGEALINTLVLDTFVAIKQDIDEGVCSSGVDGYTQVRSKVKELIKSTNIVLVQMLLHHIQVTQNSNFIELYSLALLPQIAACDTMAYQKLMDLTVVADMTSDDTSSIISTLQGAFSCMNIACEDVGSYQGGRLPQCTDPNTIVLASYTPTTDVRNKAYIDRDLRHIKMFLRLNAHSAVKDYYKYGWNTDFSLQELASNNFSLVTSVEFDRFQLYYPEDNFADNMIMSILDKEAPFDTASSEDRANAVVGVLEGIVMYFSTASEFESAVTACNNAASSSQSALSYWDGGVAFYIGSMEGETESLDDTGSLLFGLAISLCDNFNICETQDSSINQNLLDYFEYGRNSLAGGSCQDALTIVQQNIKPYLMIPLIQATLYYAAATLDFLDEGSLGGLYAYSRAILPVINGASTTAATSLSGNTDFGMTPNVAAVFEAFRTALVNMDTDCRRIGKLNMLGGSYGVCPDDAPVSGDNGFPTPTPAISTKAPSVVPPVDPNGIAWGRYTFLNQEVADNDSQFSFDIKDMALSADVAEAGKVYRNPSKYALNGLYGGVDIMSLSDFSRKALEFMSEDPLYSFYRVAFYEDEDFDKTPDEQSFPFADTVVELALNPNKGDSPQLASDTSVVMHSFMMISHRLYESVRRCKQQVSATEMIDSAVAMWIGQEQGEGSFDSGWMLYAQAQQALKKYGGEETEAPINTELMQLLNDAQNIAGECELESTTYQLLAKKVDVVLKAFSKILLQLLLTAVSENNRNYVELYALSFIPHAAACDMGAYGNLRDALFLDFDRSILIDDSVINNLSKVLSCLRYTCEDLGDISQSRAELQDLVTAICVQMEKFQSNSVAGYLTDSDVSELARIDLDINQIDIFMRTKSYQLALDYYVNGRNSMDTAGNLISLQSLASDDERSNAGNWYDLYEEYFLTGNYTNELILSAINNWQGDDGVFASASRRQLSEAVTRTLQTMVPSMQIAAKLRSSIARCKSSQSGVQLVDEAAALFVGSIEGPELGGDPNGSGKLLYALGKEMCKVFDKCEDEDDDAAANEFVLVSLRDMKRSMSSNDCDGAEVILEDLLSTMQVPLVQGTLAFAVANEQLAARSTEMSLASGSVLANSILPLVNNADQTSAATIQSNMEFHLDALPVIEGAESVFKAFLAAYTGMNINCNVVGVIADMGLSACGEAAVEPERETPTDLGEDLYTTTTYVQDKANIALDVQMMQEALIVGREALARIIYKEGENSPIYNEDGVKTDLRSLSTFSTGALETMKSNPLYQVAVYALRDSQGMYLGEEAWQYADTIVQEALTEGASLNSPVAVEAAVVLNLWMELVKDLHQTVTNCKNKMFGDNEAVHYIDGAVAYWIGDGEVADSNNSKKGHLFYALAEELGAYFDTMQSSQSTANTNILRLFHQAKLELSLPSACSEEATTRRLSHIVNKIISQMILVNVQGLIHNLRMGDRTRVRIYAHAYVPFIAACSPTEFDYLRSKLIDYSHSEIEVESIVEAIRRTLPCFNIACEDVGVHKTEATSMCGASDDDLYIASYKSATDSTNLKKIDLDIQEIDILMRMQAYEAAEELYSYGKHVMMEDASEKTALSLQYLTTSLDRTNVPQFASFKRYFGGDSDYADTIVRYVFMSNNGLGPEERRRVFVGVASYIAVYMGVLKSMQDSIDACANGEEKASAAWDQAAAWLIGSMEGTSNAGSTEGRLLWALSKEHCTEFGTCSNEVRDSSDFNDRVVLQLVAGRSATLTRSCKELVQAADQIAFLMPVPLIQGAISTAFLLQQSKGERQRALLAQAYVFSQAILPLIQDVDKDAAKTIGDSFNLMTGEVLPRGLPAVVAAYSRVLSGMGIDCNDVGSSDSVDTCSGTVKKKGLIAGLVLSVLAMLLAGYILWRYNRTRKARRPENNPVFVSKKTGEFNHDADFAGRSSKFYEDDSDGSDDLDLDRIGAMPLDEDEYALPKELMDDSDDDEIQVV